MLSNTRNSKFVVYHYNNDYSGSTGALFNRLSTVQSDKYTLITLSRGGALDDLNCIYLMHPRIAKFIPIPIKLIYFWMITSLIAIIYKKEVQEFNNLLSIPALFILQLAAPNADNHYVYLHEFKVNNRWLNKFLSAILLRINSKFIFVSEYHRNFFEKKYQITGEIKLNKLDPTFRKLSPALRHNNFNDRFRITFVGSTSQYKGMHTFIALSAAHPKRSRYRWTLVTPGQINEKSSNNVDIFKNPDKKLMASVYSESLIVLNLSDTLKWVETFGMTIFEAAAFGALTITPSYGGFVDYVSERWSFAIDTTLSEEEKMSCLIHLIDNVTTAENWKLAHNHLLRDINSSPTLMKIIGS